MGYIKLSKERELQLVDDYRNGMPVEQVREKYGFKTRKSVTDKIKKYYPNEYESIIKENHDKIKGYSFTFDKITTEFDAYLLGLWLTDGYITTRGTDIGIDLIDEDCISFLSKVVGKSYKTYDFKNSKSEGTRYRLVLSFGQDIKKLERFGLVKNKSLTLKGAKFFPEEEKFIPYVIRGIIDGDGSVFQTSYGAPEISICSASYDFIYWIKDMLENKLYLRNINISSNNSNGCLMYKIQIADQDNIQKIIALCYNKPFGMERKYIKLRQMFRDYNKDIFS